MRELAILTFLTLDGVMQAPSMADEDRSGGFAHGGWAAPYWEATMAHVLREAMAEPYDMLFGRKTYDLFASHWPTAPKSPVSDRMNAARKLVVTSQMSGLDWENTHPITGDIIAALSTIKAQDGPLLQVHGSGQLIQLLLAHGLIDEFRLWTFPVLVGGGKRLFEDGVPHQTLTRENALELENGVTMAVYRR